MKTASKLIPLEEMATYAYATNGNKPKGTGLLSPNIDRCKTSQDVLDFARKRALNIVDFKFTDLLGRWHHFSMPAHHLDEDVFEEGLGFDGSSIRAFQDIHESDMVLFPDATTAIVDPAMEIPPLSNRRRKSRRFVVVCCAF